MRIGTKNIFALSWMIAVVSIGSTIAHAQAAGSSEKLPRPELALDYSYLHSNAPPGGCGCFNMNGGSATFAWPVNHGGIAVAGDVTIAHAGAIANSGYSLTLSTFSAGIRYEPASGHATKTWQPFGQVLAGIGHSSGSLVDGQSSATKNAGAAFAGSVGGGLDLRASHRFAIRLIEAQYLATTFDNGVNNHQNNLRVSAGIVVRF